MKALSRIARRPRKLSKMQMAPMIDMVFLLLVFFMTVSSISQAGFRAEVDLAKSTQSAVPDDLSERIIVSIDEDNKVYLNGIEMKDTDLAAALSDLAVKHPRLKLNIRADKNTPYESIRKIMQKAAAAGISNIIYATHQAG